MTARESNLPLKLALAWTLLILYASLYPLSGWRDVGISPFAFLAAGWPRYFTGFDLTVNLLAYLPLGLFWAAALLLRLPTILAFLGALFIGSSLSLGVEAAQSYLPSRVPSNLDFACNTLGTTCGALLGIRWGRALRDGGRLHRWRNDRFMPGASGDFGLLLVALWLLTQLNPENMLFGSGNLRSLIGLPPALPFEAARFGRFELTVVAMQTLAVALIGARLARRHPVRLPLALLSAGLIVKSAAFLVLMQGAHGLVWATPASLGGLALGVVLWGVAMTLAPGLRPAMAALALMLATVIANLMPDNPYQVDTLRIWQQGHFLNFNGLIRLCSALWPFLALPWLMLTRSER